MRVLTGLMLLMLLALPDLATSQSFELYGSAGPTITDAGHSFAAGGGFSPTSRLTILASFERTHLSTQTSFDGQVFSAFRGGTLSIGTAELRVIPLGRSRFGPYGLAGFAAGVSRPNVNEQFPNPVTNDVRALFVGGGLQVPLSARVAAFGDVRMMFGSEGIEGIVAVAPVRAGISFRF